MQNRKEKILCTKTKRKRKPAQFPENEKRKSGSRREVLKQPVLSYAPFKYHNLK